MNYWLHPEAREDLREAAEYSSIIDSERGSSCRSRFSRSSSARLTSSYAIRASEPFGGTASAVLSWGVSRMA